MSVRRLAEAAVQPPAFAFNRNYSAQVKTWIRKYPKGREQSAVIPLLMLAQEQEGWVTKAAIEHVADMLAMPYIRALEVATFYTQFQLKPVGSRAHVQVCGTTPCMLRGAEALIDVCRDRIHHDQFHTNAKGTLSWEEVECLGACVNAPMVMIFSDTYEDLTPQRLGEIIDAFAAGKGKSVPTGPQVDRIVSAPQSGLTSLIEEKAILKSTRDKEARAAARGARAAPVAAVSAPPVAAAPAAVTAPLPPSNAAKPKTDAPETSPAIATPSAVKVEAGVEAAASVAAPAHDAENANKATEHVEMSGKQRISKDPEPGPAQAFKSPELSRSDAVGNATESPAKGESPAKPAAEDNNGREPE